jgi:hypothetical protein
MINLFVNYYEEQNPKRRSEIETCLRNNTENPYINYMMIESLQRMTYSNFFKIINEYTSVDDINIIANLDIYFDDTVKILEGMGVNEAFTLGRWDLKKDGNICLADRPDSQDAWVIKGKVKNVNGAFNLGYCGCDNRIAHELHKSGYVVSNPCRTIKAIHVHTSNIRNYKSRGKDRKKFVVSGPYRTVSPTEWKSK